MQNIIIAALAGIILAVSIRLREKNREIGRLKEQIHQEKEETKALQAQLQALRTRVSDMESAEDELWDYANTIHLYAALSQEEARQLSFKEKQAEILQAAEDMLELIKK